MISLFPVTNWLASRAVGNFSLFRTKFYCSLYTSFRPAFIASNKLQCQTVLVTIGTSPKETVTCTLTFIATMCSGVKVVCSPCWLELVASIAASH